MAVSVDLAHRPRFSIGPIEIRPATLEVVGPSGRERIEPRVMQVLLVLADADGSVVSRDDLTAACWDNRIVGDDAISRVIARIRRLSEGVAAGGFTLQTIPKVGYRLVPAGADADAAPSHRPPAAPSRTRTWLPRLMAAAAVAALLGAGMLEMRGTPTSAARPGPAPVAAQPAAADSAARDLELRARAAAFEGSTEQLERALGYLKAATAQTPDRASAWGALAHAYARALGQMSASPDDRSFEVKAREAARRALALNSRDGDALAALAMLEPLHHNWARKDAVLHRAMAAAPSEPALMLQRARFLAHVGRTREAMIVTERVAALSPLVPWVQRGRMTLLAGNGRLDEAERVAELTAALWPNDYTLWFDRLLLHAFHGGGAKAEAMIADRVNWPKGTAETHILFLGRAASAIASGSQPEADAVVDHLTRRIEQESIHPVQAIRIAAALGRIDAAMAMAEATYLAPRGPRIAEHNVAPLFVPPGDRLWTHPRFMPLMAEIGLVDYWRRTGAPDLCRSAARTCIRYGLSRGSGVLPVRMSADARAP